MAPRRTTPPDLEARAVVGGTGGGNGDGRWDLEDDLVEIECQRWKGKGVNIKYEVRGNRKGYKAGALKEGRPIIMI
ncbi:hypothetical protein ZWY2020_017182 [Hordeum vulgare]|nr:hypothetical protein ZWY2020_017182 [Hordeum vulgare]